MAQPAGSAWTRRRVAMSIGFVVVALLAIGVCAVAVLAKRVEGQSMTPTLRNGQRLLTEPFTSGSADRFDIVVLHAPDNDGTVVKRVIGIPGDAIEIRADGSTTPQVLLRPHDQGRWMRVENTAWDAQWATPTPCCSATGKRSTAPQVAIVPPGKCFALGDDPDVSIDSRTFGWVDNSSIEGRVWIRVWPLPAAGSVTSDVGLIATSTQPS